MALNDEDVQHVSKLGLDKQIATELYSNRKTKQSTRFTCGSIRDSAAAELPPEKRPGRDARAVLDDLKNNRLHMLFSP
jgi:hypothetical protein